MKLNKSLIIITGGANGIGRAIAKRFAKEGAKVVVADTDYERAAELAELIGGVSFFCDVSKEQSIIDLVTNVESKYGTIDLFCSNAGVIFDQPDNATSTENIDWQISWDVNVMAHVYAARACLPAMIKKGGGYFLQIISAAGLLSQIGNAAYSTTKHASIGFAESLFISHVDDGIKVSVVCPQYVATSMIDLDYSEVHKYPEYILSVSEVADVVVQGLKDEEFLILPHPEVKKHFHKKATDYQRWLSGMNKIKKKALITHGDLSIKSIIKSL